MPAKTTKTKRPYVIVRGRDSGVHAGELVRRSGKDVELVDARRIWYWRGAASLSELSQHGAGEGSKIAVVVPRVEIVGDVCEILYCSPEAERWLREVAAWRA